MQYIAIEENNSVLFRLIENYGKVGGEEHSHKQLELMALFSDIPTNFVDHE